MLITIPTLQALFQSQARADFSLQLLTPEKYPFRPDQNCDGDVNDDDDDDDDGDGDGSTHCASPEIGLSSNQKNRHTWTMVGQLGKPLHFTFTIYNALIQNLRIYFCFGYMVRNPNLGSVIQK